MRRPGVVTPTPPPPPTTNSSATIYPDPASASSHALRGVTDPRWVLAVRAAEQLEGDILPLEKRDRLIKLGRMLGLTPFDANLVIAIVQDQSRRGHRDSPAAAGADQLAMIPLPGSVRSGSGSLSKISTTRTAFVVAALLAIELVIVWSLLLR